MSQFEINPQQPERAFAGGPERELLFEMLKPAGGDRALVIGCRNGDILLSFTEMGVRTTALEPSLTQQALIKQVTGNRVDFQSGDLADLPFDDNHFNYVCLINVIEFMENPEKAIEEALRVAKDKVFIGMLNKYSVKGLEAAIKRLVGADTSLPAKLFGIWELKQTIHNICAEFPVYWRTVSHFPAIAGQVGHQIARSGVVQKYPFGSFVGVLVIPIPQFRLTVLPLRCHGQTESIVTG